MRVLQSPCHGRKWHRWWDRKWDTTHLCVTASLFIKLRCFVPNVKIKAVSKIRRLKVLFLPVRQMFDFSFIPPQSCNSDHLWPKLLWDLTLGHIQLNYLVDSESLCVQPLTSTRCHVNNSETTGEAGGLEPDSADSMIHHLSDWLLLNIHQIKSMGAPTTPCLPLNPPQQSTNTQTARTVRPE